MKTLEEKLSMFYDLAFSAATGEKTSIIEEATKVHDTKKEEAIKNAKEQSVAYVKSEFQKIKKECNSVLLKEQQEMKNHLLRIRENMIEEVFMNARNKLLDFMNSGEYEEYLLNLIELCIKEIGEGELIITVSNADLMRFKDKISIKFANTLIEKADEDIIGGCIVLNKSKGTLSDNTFKTMLEEQKNDFLSICKLVIS